jgi:hypothetical protein
MTSLVQKLKERFKRSSSSGLSAKAKEFLGSNEEGEFIVAGDAGIEDEVATLKKKIEAAHSKQPVGSGS